MEFGNDVVNGGDRKARGRFWAGKNNRVAPQVEFRVLIPNALAVYDHFAFTDLVGKSPAQSGLRFRINLDRDHFRGALLQGAAREGAVVGPTVEHDGAWRDTKGPVQIDFFLRQHEGVQVGGSANIPELSLRGAPKL